MYNQSRNNVASYSNDECLAAQYAKEQVKMTSDVVQREFLLHQTGCLE